MKLSINVGAEMEKYVKNLEAFANATDGMLKATIYPGAKVMADEMREAIRELPEITVQTRKRKGSNVKRPKDTRKRTGKKRQAGITKVEKEGLLEGLGITSMRYNGSLLNAKIGMDGYNKHITEKWPKGHPNAMVARSLESGTSFRQKTPFIAPTAQKFKDKAERNMAKEFDEQVKKNWKQ